MLSKKQVHWPGIPPAPTVQYTLWVWHCPHGIVPYDVPDVSDAREHWLDAPHCTLLVH